MSIGLEYISNAHTFRRAKIRCRAIFTTYSHTYRHLEHTAKRRKRASPTRRRRRRRRHRNARRARTRHQAAQRPCHAHSPATSTCHTGTGSSGPAAAGHRWPTNAGRRSRAMPLVRSGSSAAWPRATAHAPAAIHSTPAAILRTRSSRVEPNCRERPPSGVSQRHGSWRKATGDTSPKPRKGFGWRVLHWAYLLMTADEEDVKRSRRGRRK